MKKRLGTILIAFMLLVLVTTSASAQDYSFSMPKLVVDIYVNKDGSYSIDYAFSFKNDPGAPAIQYVDVGMPNGNFSGTSASINGTPVEISNDYQGNGDYGFAVNLGLRAIMPGETGTVRVHVDEVRQALYPDDTNSSDASVVFSPTWFGSNYVHGNTNLTVSIHLPPGVKPEEPRYHTPADNWPGSSDPTVALDDEGRVTYTWQSPQANGSTQYYFGASFPAAYVPASAIVQQSFWEKIGINPDDLFGYLICCGFLLIVFGSPVLGVINERKRKMQYLPPKISIEGHGIKRGLTAVEAAILMQQPLDKVMTMILFGVVKKDAAEVVTRDPLKLKVNKPLPNDLREYEGDFLAAFEFEKKSEQRKALQDMTVKLVKTVGEKMKGFSRKETIDYYKAIMERAWQQIDAADTPEVKSQMFDEALEWTMLDKDYDDRTRRTFTGPVYVPMWWGRYDPSWGRAATSSTPSMPGMNVHTGTPSGARGLPGSSFAASVVGGVQSMASGVIGDVGSFTGGVTKTTNPPPPPSSSSGGSRSGGGGCACACACAGCACACAGGGR